MASFFLDTSAIIKRYVTELGSGWIIRLTDPAAGNLIQLARITGVECIAAIARLARGGRVHPALASAWTALFRWEIANVFRTVPTSPRVMIRAMDLAEIHGLRGCDAVQLAAALHANRHRQRPMPFISADTTLNAAAVAEGLPVDDPNAHP